LRELLPHARDAGASFVILRMVRERGELLREDALSWGRVAAHLYDMDRHDHVIRWCADWQRADARPWMLNNLALAFWTVGRIERASVVSDCALRLPPDHTTPNHHLLAACTALRCSDLEAARAHYACYPNTFENEFYRRVHELVGLALEIHANPDRSAGSRIARDRLRGLRPARRWFSRPGVHLRVYRICARSIAYERDSWWARVRTMLRDY
jgi:hypothetical protein